MSTMRDFLEVIRERGCLHQCSDEAGFKKLTAEKIVTGYIGFDPSAASLHVGSLLPVMALARFQRCGHLPHGQWRVQFWPCTRLASSTHLDLTSPCMVSQRSLAAL